MMAVEERPSIGEQYSSATESSNLKLGERRGDVDVIIAAGLVPDTLASTLYRLLVEYDGVRAVHIAAENRMRSMERMAPKEEGEDDETGKSAAERTVEMLNAAEREARTAHVLILAQLTSLREAKRRFGDFAVVEATKQRFMRPDREVLLLAGQVLDVFLNPNCRHCQGRGFNGGSRPDEPKMLCRPCRGSGHRRDMLGKDAAQRLFASRLIAATDAMMFEVQRDLRTGLNMVRQAKEKIAAGT
jgi:hypothetical protein